MASDERVAANRQEVSREELERRVEGWMRTAQTSEREVAWLRKALGIKDTFESCAIRDAMERVQAKDQNPHLADMAKLTVAATRGAIWLEETWREQAKMWERRCNEATRALSDAGLLAKPPQAVLDALEAWLEEERPSREVTFEDVDRNVRWSVVRQWFEAAGGGS